MSWVIAGMAGLGLLQGAANQKKMERQNQYRAEAIKYSPWTGMGDPGTKELPDALQMGLQGAAMGAMMGNAMGGGGGGGGTTTGSAGAMGAANKMDYQGANYLGGQDMSAQLGARYGSENIYNPYTLMASNK